MPPAVFVFKLSDLFLLIKSMLGGTMYLIWSKISPKSLPELSYMNSIFSYQLQNLQLLILRLLHLDELYLKENSSLYIQ